MSDKLVSPGKRFGITRDNFILDPVEDHACFARKDPDPRQIAEGLDIDVVTGMAPKRLAWGPYGGGKTHTLMRTMEELANLTPIHSVRIECPVLARKSRFHDLYREGIMRTMGQDFVLGLLEQVVEKVGFKRSATELHTELKGWLGDEEIAKAVERIYVPNYDRLKLWRWVSGVPMSRSDLDELNQTQDLTQAEPTRLSEVVIMLGRLLKRLEEKTLVLILDEMERLGDIGQDTITTFMSGFTRLVDPGQTSVAILIGTSAALETEMVDIFSGNSPVVSRLGPDAKVEIPALEDPDVEEFVEGVLKYLRIADFNVDEAINAVPTPHEHVTAALYPFTDEAISAIKTATHQLTPRAICMQMTKALGRTYRQQLALIDSSCIE